MALVSALRAIVDGSRPGARASGPPRRGAAQNRGGRDARAPGRFLVAFLAMMLAGCASAATPIGGRSPSSVPSAEQRTLTIAIWGEPASMASVPVRDSGHSLRGATRLFNAELDI